jgi:(p)ppGpp synthase/HD superfamily hydrolase
MPTPWNLELYHQAFTLAARAHANQWIAQSDVPYMVHVAEVANETLAALLATAPGLDWDLALACALLHDTIEDTSVTYAQVAGQFGERVAQGVLALTKNPDLPKADQMADSLARILTQSAEVRLVKMADRVSNLREPPPHWANERRVAYRAEAEVILATLGGVCPAIEERLGEKIKTYSQYLL